MKARLFIMSQQESNQAATESSQAATVSTVGVKLPPFWPNDPRLWFAQVEAQFHTRIITAQKTRFDYVIASLSPEIATEVRDLILQPPTNNPYNTLRQQLIRRTSTSEQSRLQQLLAGLELGDSRPTRLLRRMQALLSGDTSATDSALFRELFLQRLPSNVRMVVASSTDSDVQQLAELADRIMDASTSNSSITTVADSQNSSLQAEINSLRADVSDLKKLLEDLSVSQHGSRGARKPDSASQPQTNLCWYHFRFGDAAKKCKAPCSKAGNFKAGH